MSTVPTPTPVPKHKIKVAGWLVVAGGLLLVVGVIFTGEWIWKKFHQPTVPYVMLPDKVTGQVGDFITVRPSDTNGKIIKWVAVDKGLSVFPNDLLRDDTVVIVSSRQEGTYRLLAYTAGGKGIPSDPAITVVVIGNPKPPVPPEPPVPPVPPTPPEPPAPIPVAGNKVLIIFDGENAAKLTKEQKNILYATSAGSVRDYLNKKTPVGADGKTHDWRMWPKDTSPPTGDASYWDDAFKRPHDTLPWIVISTGKTGFEGPLPATTQDTLTLLNKYFGG